MTDILPKAFDAFKVFFFTYFFLNKTFRLVSKYKLKKEMNNDVSLFITFNVFNEYFHQNFIKYIKNGKKQRNFIFI